MLREILEATSQHIPGGRPLHPLTTDPQVEELQSRIRALFLEAGREAGAREKFILGPALSPAIPKASRRATMMFQNSTDCVNRCREAPKRRTLELPGAGGLPWFRRGESSQESLKKLALSLVDTDPSFLKAKPICAVNFRELLRLTGFRWPFHGERIASNCR